MRKGQRKRPTIYLKTTPRKGGGRNRLSVVACNDGSVYIYDTVYDASGSMKQSARARLTVEELRSIADAAAEYNAKAGV